MQKRLGAPCPHSSPVGIIEQRATPDLGSRCSPRPVSAALDTQAGMRYAANLLFEYGVDGQRQARPLCEKRIVLLKAPNAREAVRRARRYGKRHQLSYSNADGRRFRIRFLGLVDVLALEYGEADEVYYSLFRTSRPARHLRDESRFAALRSGPRTIRSGWWAVPAWLARRGRQKGRRRRGV